MLEKQTRFLSVPGLECRVEKRVGTDPPGSVIVGYAAPFYRAENPGTEYQLDGDLSERIMPSAFNRALKECDIRCLFNHDVNNILGRNIAGTLSLSVDKVGLRYRAVLPDTSFAQDVATSVARGDVTGSSFSFLPYEEEDSVVMVSSADGRRIRELRSVRLFDVGPVTFPAYQASTSGVGRAISSLAEFRSMGKTYSLPPSREEIIRRANEVAADKYVRRAKREKLKAKIERLVERGGAGSEKHQRLRRKLKKLRK